MRRGLMMLVAVAWMGLLAGGCAKETDQPQAGDKPPTKAGKVLRIAVIPKGTTHEFWKSVHAGAKRAEKELEGVRIDWQGPVREDARSEQVSLVETFIQKRVDGIVLAPLDDKALIAPVQQAKEAGIPVVIIDSDLAAPDAYVSFVATDNYQGGVLGARRLASVLGDKGNVVLLRYQVGSASTDNRERGFLDEMAKHPGLKMVSSDQYAGATAADAMTVAQSLLVAFPEGKVDGIFCPNESSAFAMLQALSNAGRLGKVKYVAFDVSPQLLGALRKGGIEGLVVQNPERMGCEGVKMVVAHIRGETVPKRIDTGVVVVTPENLSDPEIEKLVHPPQE